MGLLGNKNKFTKAKGRSAHPYGDPTFLSFFLLFDWYGPKSPLFNGDATNFLRNVIGDNNRADQLEKFKKYLKRINQEMPWFWQSINGLNAAYDYGKMDDALVFKEGGVIEIDCLETLDFTMAGIFNMYQSIVLDTERYVQVLPDNLCYFNVYVHVQEIRNFVPFIGSTSNLEKFGAAASDIVNFKSADGATRKEFLAQVGGDVLGKIEDRLNSDQLDWKSKGLGPRFITKLGKCKFNYNNGMDMFSEISNAELGSPVHHKLKFKFHTSKVHEVEYLTGFNHVDPDPLSPFNNDILNDLANTGLAAVTTAGNQALTAGTAAAERALEDFKNKLLLGNVYGVNTLSKIEDVFNSGSINAIGPLVKGEDPSRETVNEGDAVGENAYDENELPPAEVALESTKIYEDTPEEQPLSSSNTMPITSPEVPLESTKIYDDAPEEGTLNSTRIYDNAPEEQPLNSTKIYDDAPPESPLENSNVYE